MSDLSALDIRRPIRYARARVYSFAVRVHYQVFFARHLGADPTGSGRAAALLMIQAPAAVKAETSRIREVVSLPAPLCDVPCEIVGGEDDCTCLTVHEFRARLESRLARAPFSGTPYDAGSEED